MPFGPSNAHATFQREINSILQFQFGFDLDVNSNIRLGEDKGIVGVACIDDILITTMGLLDKHHRQVSIVFQLLMDNNMCNHIGKCVFVVTETTFFGSVVSGSSVLIDPDDGKAMVDWPRPTSRMEVQQLLGLWNFYWRFKHNLSAIISPITDLLRQDIMFGC